MDRDELQSQQPPVDILSPVSSHEGSNTNNDEEAPPPVPEEEYNPRAVDLPNVFVVAEPVEDPIAPPQRARAKQPVRFQGIRCCVWQIFLTFVLSSVVLLIAILVIVIVHRHWAIQNQVAGTPTATTTNPILNATTRL